MSFEKFIVQQKVKSAIAGNDLISYHKGSSLQDTSKRSILKVLSIYDTTLSSVTVSCLVYKRYVTYSN